MASATTAPAEGLTRRHVRDQSWERFGNVVLAGSPLTVFRATEAGGRVLDAIERDEVVAASPLVDRLLETGSIHPVPEQPSTLSMNDVSRSPR